MEILVYGTVQSAALLLMALGFSLVYGVSRLPNFAHGALYVATGYAAWVLHHRAGLPYPAAALCALAAAALGGVLIYRLVLRRVRGMEISEVIATWALGLAILEGLRWAGLRGATHALPAVAGDLVEVFGVPLDRHRVLVIAAAGVVLAALYLAVHTTRTGLALTGVAQDERAAMTLGIDPDTAGTVAVAVGSALAGLGALLLFPLGSVVVQEGYKVLIYALAVCVVGGLGSWRGTVLASLALGFAQAATVAWGKPHYQMVVMLLAIVLTLTLRPSGLFGRQRELEQRA